MILDEITNYLDSIKIRYNIENNNDNCVNITLFIGSSEGFLQIENMDTSFICITYSKTDDYDVAMFDETDDTIEEVIESINALIIFLKSINKIESKIESKIEEIKELSLSLRDCPDDFVYFMKKYLDN